MKIDLALLSTMIFLVAIIYLQSGAHLMSTLTSFGNAPGQNQSTIRRDGYRMIEAGKGETNDGILASFSTYESPDGVTIFTRTEYFRSAADMKTQFETKTKSFYEIIERKDVRDTKGDRTGERIVGKELADEGGKEKYAITWWHEHKISYIESASLDHILDFEKNFYKSRK